MFSIGTHDTIGIDVVDEINDGIFINEVSGDTLGLTSWCDTETQT